MQFFYLFSLVVAVSYAAALPRPAGLSEKYSNSANTTLASGLEARSYQPVLNSYKDSATLMSLKRRDDSGSGSSLPSDTTPNETDDPSFIDRFTDTINLASKIVTAINHDSIFFDEGRLAAQKIDGPVAEIVAKYLRRDVYVAFVLSKWVDKSVLGIRDYIKSGLGENEYSKIEPDLTKDIKKLEYDFKVGYDEILVYISKIAKGDGTVTYNFQKVDTLFEDFFYGNMEFIRKLRFQLEKFEAGETLKKSLADIVGAVNDFILNQSVLCHKIIKGLDAASS
ncbi:hypothetical protein BASA50_010320 [Batrachochytrium salamandrivorans]|uniref:Uncharacterized protein n=1 Tax=Batrachochytrium salamandrivorans TaxID=1357716 RepID=A0ABQ8EYV1_9FUNG|nr:hypothetical protein BASA50_010320 [Batrachochytrium salamandrivorans]